MTGAVAPGGGREALLGRLAGAPDRARRVLSANHPARKPGEWSDAEIVRHLLAVDREVWHRRLADLASGAEPVWQSVEPGLADPPGDGSLEAAIDVFASARAETVRRFRALDDAGWARAGQHLRHGRLDALGLLRLAVDHDEEHLGGHGAGA